MRLRRVRGGGQQLHEGLKMLVRVVLVLVVKGGVVVVVVNVYEGKSISGGLVAALGVGAGNARLRRSRPRLLLRSRTGCFGGWRRLEAVNEAALGSVDAQPPLEPVGAVAEHGGIRGFRGARRRCVGAGFRRDGAWSVEPRECDEAGRGAYGLDRVLAVLAGHCDEDGGFGGGDGVRRNGVGGALDAGVALVPREPAAVAAVDGVALDRCVHSCVETRAPALVGMARRRRGGRSDGEYRATRREGWVRRWQATRAQPGQSAHRGDAVGLGVAGRRELRRGDGEREDGARLGGVEHQERFLFAARATSTGRARPGAARGLAAVGGVLVH